MCYLQGSEFRTDMTVLTAPPRCDGGIEIYGDRPFKLQFKLYFAREMTKWGLGGVAFVETEPVTPAPTFGRAYLLTLQQFRCVAREENGGSHPVNIKNGMLFGPAGTTHEITTDHLGWYPVLLLCGSLNYMFTQIPAVTLTGWPEKMVPKSRPSTVYLTTIRNGLKETYPISTYHDMTDHKIDEYLREAYEV